MKVNEQVTIKNSVSHSILNFRAADVTVTLTMFPKKITTEVVFYQGGKQHLLVSDFGKRVLPENFRPSSLAHVSDINDYYLSQKPGEGFSVTSSTLEISVLVEVDFVNVKAKNKQNGFSQVIRFPLNK